MTDETPDVVSPALLEAAARLAVPATRAAGAAALATAWGADTLLVFVRDQEIGALLTAPGFPTALPDGKRWREFLAACAERGEHRGTLPFRTAQERLLAVGFAASPDVQFVLLGTEMPAGDVAWFRTLLPLFAAVFRGEQTAASAMVQARLAHESAARAATLTQTLDRTRRQLEDALGEARDARAEVERTNTKLVEHARRLEMANEELLTQTDAMEAQALELETQAEDLQMANAALEEARSLAEMANRAKSEFLATMSHELRTPLNAIGGHVQLIEMGVHGPVTAEQRQALARIDRSQRHLLGLINDVLNLSRIEAGRVEYAMTDVPLSAALADLTPMIEPQLTAKALAFEVSADWLPSVRADWEKLQQILLNLLSNAVKFTAPRGRVCVDARRREGAPGKVFVRVADTGQGIPRDKLDRIFEPFMQVDASHSRLGQGIGLGLAISRDLARGMGGDLRVRSELGAGAVFTLTLEEAGARTS